MAGAAGIVVIPPRWAWLGLPISLTRVGSLTLRLPRVGCSAQQQGVIVHEETTLGGDGGQCTALVAGLSKIQPQ